MAGVPIAFLHIHKTGGTTLKAAMTRVFGGSRVLNISTANHANNTRDVRAFLADPDPHIAVVTGHFWIGALVPAPGPHRRITMLRHPVDRLLSLYYYFLKRQEMGRWQEFAGMENPTLQEAIRAAVPDRQVKALSRGMPPRESTREDLETAKRHLAESFAAFGLQERFNESLVLFAQSLGWERLPLYRRYKRSRRPREVPPGIPELVAELNPLDMELYAYAEALFAERIAAQPPAYRRALAQFQMVNSLYAPAAGLRDRLRGWKE